MSIPRRSPKILVILGPTASGKSELAVKIAKWAKQHGAGAEIISADSRQVYRGLNIGTVKVPGKWQMARSTLQPGSGQAKRKATRSTDSGQASEKYFVYKGIRHHLIDFANPKRQYSSGEYANAARKKLHSLLANGYLPIICGGTGHYIASLLGEQNIPNVPPDPKLRARFDKLTAKQLFEMLRKLDPRRASEIDRHNSRRLIRALEIIARTGKPVPRFARDSVLFDRNSGAGEVLKIGLSPSLTELRQRINARLQRDLKRGLIREVKNLHANGLSWKRLDELGLEYRYVARYLRGKLTHDQLLMTLQNELWRYVKRQMQWFKRDKEITWAGNESEALAKAKNFLK